MTLSLFLPFLAASTIPARPNAPLETLTQRQFILVNALVFRDSTTQPKVMSMRQLPFPKVEAHW